MKTAQNAIETFAGIPRDPGIAPPLNGPGDLDHAVSEVANRTARIVGVTPLEWPALPGAFQELVGVIWRPSGLTQRIENPPVNKSIRVSEGQDHWEEIHKLDVLKPLIS
jgi:hypothetical protein